MIKIKVEIEDVDSTLVDKRGKTFFVEEKRDRVEWTQRIGEMRKYLEGIREITAQEIISGGKNEVENDRKR